MSSYSSITMQKPGGEPIKITMEDAVIIMTNQQKTIEELIQNNQRMYNAIEELKKTGNLNNINIEKQNTFDPIEIINAKDKNTIPNTLSPKPQNNDSPMTLSEFLAKKNKTDDVSNKIDVVSDKIDEVPVFDIPSKI